MVPGGRIQFIDKPNGASTSPQQPPADEQAPGAADLDDENPF